MQVDTNILNEDYITQLANKNEEPEWMLNLRLKAFKAYQELPLPKFEKTKIDKWNIDSFQLSQVSEKINNLNELDNNYKSLISEQDENILIQKDSVVIYQNLIKELTDKGVILTDLDSALKNYPDLAKKYFMKSVNYDDNKLVALHTALWSGGLFLYIPKNVEVELPIQALYLSDNGDIIPHLLIVAEEYSKLTYVDYYFSSKENTNSIHNGIVEIFVGQNAKVKYITTHNFNSGNYDYSYRNAVVERDGRIDWIVGELNSGNIISNTTSHLNDSQAQADIKSVFVGTGNQKANFVAKIIHKGDHTTSNILSHGVMLDESTAILNGITIIEKGAAKSNAEQAEKILMLSKDARGDANPFLFIDEHDVMAGHAASAGPVNPEDIYYLMSRGISEKEAKRLIINGFLAPVVAKIPIENIKVEIQKEIERKLE